MDLGLGRYVELAESGVITDLMLVSIVGDVVPRDGGDRVISQRNPSARTVVTDIRQGERHARPGVVQRVGSRCCSGRRVQLSFLWWEAAAKDPIMA